MRSVYGRFVLFWEKNFSAFFPRGVTNLYKFYHLTTVVLDLAVDDDVVSGQVSGLLDSEDGVYGASAQDEKLVDDASAQVDAH